MKDIFKMIVIAIGITLMCNGWIKILERDKQQTEQIKILEQSLAEQRQEKQVYMKMLEEVEDKQW